MLQSKQSDKFDTLHLTHVVVVVSGFRCEAFFQIPSPSFCEKRKEVENEEKTKKKKPAKKAKVNVNMDCFSLIKGQ